MSLLLNIKQLDKEKQGLNKHIMGFFVYWLDDKADTNIIKNCRVENIEY